MEHQQAKPKFMDCKDTIEQRSFEGRIQKLKITKRHGQLQHIEKLSVYANLHPDKESTKVTFGDDTTLSNASTSAEELAEEEALLKKDSILTCMREAFDITSSGCRSQHTGSSSGGNNCRLQKNFPGDPVMWLTDFADTIDQHKKSTEAALDFSDQMQEAVNDDIKGIKLLKAKISEQYDAHKNKGYSVDQDKKRLISLKIDMLELEKTLTAAKTRKEAAQAMFKKAKRELEQATLVEREIVSKIVAERHELANLERRVLRFGVALAEGMEYCNSKIDDANRKIRLAKALEEYSIKAKKYLLENVCNENDGALTQLIKRVHTFVKDVTNRGDRLNLVALKYAVQLLCKAWGENEGSNMPDVVMKAIKSMNVDLFQPQNAPLYSLSLPKANFDHANHTFKTVVYYHRAVYLHTNHHVEQTKRVVNCLKFLKENQKSSSKSLKNAFEIEEIDLLSTDHIPSARVLRLVHAGSYLKRVHDIAEGTYRRTSEDVKDAPVAANTSISTNNSKEEQNKEHVAEMEASDDEFIAFDVGTSLFSTEGNAKTDAFWKLLDADDGINETKHSNDRRISSQRSCPSKLWVEMHAIVRVKKVRMLLVIMCRIDPKDIILIGALQPWELQIC